MNVHAPSLTTPRRAWLRIEDFLLLVEANAFVDYGKTELIDGEILCVDAQSQRHSYIKGEFYVRIRVALGTGSEWLPLVEAAVAMPPHDVPEPDIVIMRAPIGRGWIELAQVALVVEVSESTLSTDLGRKAQLYARNGVPEYWVVDVEGRRIVRHWQAQGEDYLRRDDVLFGQVLAAATLELAIATDGLP